MATASLATALLVGAGCMFPDSYPASLTFSPDGKHIAYLWTEVVRGVNPLPPRACQGCAFPSLAQTVYIRWCPAASPGAQQSLRVHSLGTDKGDHRVASDDVRLMFSPYAPYLGVLAPQGVTIIDLQSKSSWQVTPQGEHVTSFAWSGDAEIGYAVERNRADFLETPERIIWRQDVRGTAETRLAILDGIPAWSDVPSAMPGTREHWSPKGRYMVLAGLREEANLRLIDVRLGKVTDLAAPSSMQWNVAWRPDESAALCLSLASLWTGQRTERSALLLIPETGDMIDLTSRFQAEARAELVGLQPLATAEGEYFVVRFGGANQGDWLIRPQPWRAVPIAARLQRQLRTRCPSWISVYPTQLPGWLLAAEPRGKHYLVDYEAVTVIPLGSGPCAISPDGTRVATVSPLGRLTVRASPLAAASTSAERIRTSTSPGG